MSAERMSVWRQIYAQRGGTIVGEVDTRRGTIRTRDTERPGDGDQYWTVADLVELAQRAVNT